VKEFPTFIHQICMYVCYLSKHVILINDNAGRQYIFVLHSFLMDINLFITFIKPNLYQTQPKQYKGSIIKKRAISVNKIGLSAWQWTRLLLNYIWMKLQRNILKGTSNSAANSFTDEMKGTGGQKVDTISFLLASHRKTIAAYLLNNTNI